MKDRRPVDELSIEELERVLARKKREAREARLNKFRRTGRTLRLSPANAAEPASANQLRSSSVGPALVGRAERSRARKVFDGFLLLIEIGAVVGLGYILFSGVDVLERLNREVAEAIQLPTLTPTPLITVLVLPSGHTPPTSPGGPQPNLAEIPEALRPLLQSLPTLATPTPGPQQAVRIQIPALRVDAPIVQGDTWEQLKKGVAQHLGTANPGEVGNLVLSGHNDIFGEVFRDLDQLQPGDEVLVHSADRLYTYVVIGTRVVEPTEVGVMNPTRHPSLTLISCYPYRVDDQRIVVFADLKEG